VLIRRGQVADVFPLEGALNARRVPDVRIPLHRAVDEAHGDLVVDLSEVDRIDVTGIGLLVDAHRRASRLGHRLLLRNVPPNVARMLAVTRLNRILHFESPRPSS
jgi:anti-sigma B factor antagonist